MRLRRIMRKMYNMRDMVFISSHRKSLTKYSIYGLCIFLAALITFSPQIFIRSEIYERPLKSPTDLRYILFWKSNENDSSVKKYREHFIKRSEPLFATGQTLFIKQKCPHINCYITYDRTLLKQNWYYDAVVFDINTIKHKKVESFHWKRADYQKYIFRSMASAETHYLCHKSFDNFFNWTWTYRLDSDIPHPFFNIYDKNNTIIGPKKNMTWIKEMKRIDRFRSKITNKHKAIAWIVNNCKYKTLYEDFYREFKKEIESWNYTLDTYGSCGKYPCPGGALYKCYKMIEKEYFFQIVSEDSIAEDYVSEKLVKVMQLIVIPIVIGGANYTRFLPPGTYLDNQNFDIKKLGAIIDYLIRNTLTYSYFFDWKNHYDYNSRPRNYVCDLCSKLNEKDGEIEVKKNFRKWWRPDYEDVCLRKHLYNKFARDSQNTDSQY